MLRSFLVTVYLIAFAIVAANHMMDQKPIVDLVPWIVCLVFVWIGTRSWKK